MDQAQESPAIIASQPRTVARKTSDSPATNIVVVEPQHLENIHDLESLPRGFLDTFRLPTRPYLAPIAK